MGQKLHLVLVLAQDILVAALVDYTFGLFVLSRGQFELQRADFELEGICFSSAVRHFVLEAGFGQVGLVDHGLEIRDAPLRKQQLVQVCQALFSLDCRREKLKVKNLSLKFFDFRGLNDRTLKQLSDLGLKPGFLCRGFLPDFCNLQFQGAQRFKLFFHFLPSRKIYS